MNELVIKIEKIDPKDLFGPQNKNIKFIKLKFPELKIVARGDKIKAYGNKEDLNDFEERIKKIINFGSGKWDQTTDLKLMRPATQQFFKLDISYQIKLKGRYC